MTAATQPAPVHQRVGQSLARRVMRGAVLLLPLMVTFWLIQFAFQTMDGLLQPIISAVAGDEIPGLSFAIIIVALFVVGALGSTFLLRTPGYLMERAILALPGVGAVYSTTKKLLPGSDRAAAATTGFDTVVRIEYPRQGVWSVGFLMAVIDDAGGDRVGVVYMPSTPMPQSGWLVQLPLDAIDVVDWSSAQAMQYIVSAGVTCPSSMSLRAVEGLPA